MLVRIPNLPLGYAELAFGAFPMLALATVPPSLPKKTFFRWAYTCEPVDVEEMLRHELVNEAVEADQLWERVDRFVVLEAVEEQHAAHELRLRSGRAGSGERDGAQFLGTPGGWIARVREQGDGEKTSSHVSWNLVEEARWS